MMARRVLALRDHGYEMPGGGGRRVAGARRAGRRAHRCAGAPLLPAHKFSETALNRVHGGCRTFEVDIQI